ncbi:MAG: glycosyltransferase, partial [Ignavibacteriaceae bacterium]|nr:glycosyltransferase [Ignavibacteriaceae bacterium]
GLSKLEKKDGGKLTDEFVSIIIPFRNEKEVILNSLKSVESINYPENRFEVIYVNDNSDDGSPELLRKSLTKKNIKILDAPFGSTNTAHKKKAVNFALQYAKGDIISTSDADCLHPKSWLQTLLAMFDKETGFVSGPVEFIDDGTIFGKLQKLEFMGLIIAGAGLIGIGKPAICNAANLAFRKKAFDEVGGYTAQMNLSSGDDELLMQKINRDTNYKVKFCYDEKAIVDTLANKNISQFYNQRKRWASKGIFYTDKIFIAQLLLIFLFYLSLVVTPFLGFMSSPIYFYYFGIAFILKLTFEFLIVSRGNKKLFKSDVIKWMLVTEIFQIPYIIVASISGLFGNYNWKERSIKR